MKLFSLFCVIFTLSTICAAQYNKYGNRITRTYSFPREVFENRQFVMSAQDKRGVMFFANLTKLAEYDGNEWRIVEGIDMPQALATDPYDGRIYVTSTDDFGYVAVDNSGKSSFHSLSWLLPKGTEVGLGFKIEFSEESVYFIGLKCVVEYNKSANTAELWDVSGSAHDYFEGKLYGTIRQKGIIEETKDTFYLTPVVAKSNGDILLEMYRKSKDEILMTLGSRVVLYNEKTQVTKEIKVGDFTDKLGNAGQIDKIIPINDNLMAFSTRGATPLGAYVFTDSLFNVIDYSGSNSGLSENFASSSLLGAQDGLLWTTDFGLASINTTSPIRIVGYPSEFQGSITWIAKGEELYAGTTEGLYQRMLTPSGFYKFSEMNHTSYPGVIYSMNNFKDPFTGEVGMIAFADGGVFIPHKGKALCLTTKYSSAGIQSAEDPTLIYFSSEFNIMSYKLTPDYKLKLVAEYELPPSALPVHYYNEGDYLWCVTIDYNVFRINTKTSEIIEYKKKETDNAYITSQGPVLITEEGKLVKCDANYQFTDTISTVFTDNKLEIYDSYGKGFLVYYYSKGLGFLLPKESNDREYEYIDIPGIEAFNLSSPSLCISEEDSTIYFTDDKLVGAYRTDSQFNMLRSDASRPHNTFNALVRSVQIKDSLLFAGNFVDENGYYTLTQLKSTIPTIPYSMADITFSYSATCYEQEDKTQFSFFLVGVSDTWSEWSTNHTTNFTNLWEGKYTFRVKARNIYGVESRLAEYSFVVEPPVYRSVGAFLLYFAILGLIIYQAMRIYGKRLKNENERLERLVFERTQIIRERDNEILSNINYASYIQHAALTPTDQIATIFPEHFIMYRPHSIVSGDFYLVTSFGTKKICIVGDCTGHGVSGGFLSMLGIAFFKQVVSDTQNPSQILQEMRKHIIENLHQGNETVSSQDGMDASVYVIDSETKVLEYAGANSRLVIVHKGELVELRGDKMPVSTHFAHNQDTYTNNTFSLSKGDMIYTFSDGYIDQFGGDDNKKFKMSRFRNLLLEIADKSMPEQRDIVNEVFDEFKGNNPQTDDIVVMGVRVL